MQIKVSSSAVIVLDLDDTLYHEIDFLQSGYRQVADFIISHHFDDPYEEMLKLYYTDKQPFQKVIQKYNYPFTPNQFIDIYRNHKPGIKLSPDAASFLEKIKNAGITTGLITDGRSVTQRNKIRALGIEKYFSDIIISEEFGSAKPADRNYLYFMNKYQGQAYCYIGDNWNKDFITPNRLGWLTIGLLDKGDHIHLQDRCLPAEYLPRGTINSFSEILLL